MHILQMYVCALWEERDEHSKEKVFTLKESASLGTITKRRKTWSGIGLYRK